MSKLVVIEGALDGIGKSTQFNLLKEKLINDGNKVVSHHFPTYNEYQGKLAIEYLKGKFGPLDSLSPYFVNSLYAIDRKITWDFELKNEYENGSTVLLDRYTTSSLIYQSALIEDEEEKNKFLNYIIDYEYKKLEIKEPDQVIFLMAPFDFILKLQNKRDMEIGKQVEGDIHEKDLDFMKKVYKSACYCAKYLNWTVINCVCDDEFRSKEDIASEIYNKIL